MQSIEFIAEGTLVASILIIVTIELASLIVRRAARAAGAGSVVMRDLSYSARIIEVVLIAFTITRLTGLSSDFTALTFSGIAAVAASLALQTTLANIISGILLLSDGIIRTGDNIGYGGVKGTIVRIALRSTWIKLEDGSIAVVSNTNISNGPLVNYSGADRLKKKYAID